MDLQVTPARGIRPQTARLFDAATLAAPMGAGTVDDALNGSIRFRFDKQGLPSEWKLVPDNQLSANFLAAPAGSAFASKLSAVLKSVDPSHERGLLNLSGVNLARDEAGWAATSLIQDRETQVHGTLAPPAALETAKLLTKVAGAQAISGWLQVTPDYARNILSSVGAYTPKAPEVIARSGEKASYIGGILTHELQHLVSSPDFSTPEAIQRYMPYAWLEEGTASLFAQEGRAFRDSQRRWSVTPAGHAAAIRADDSFDPSWKPWVRSAPAAAPDLGDQSQANYIDSVKTIRDLLHFTGLDLRATAGQERATRLLQDHPVQDVPQQLAKAILTHRGVDSSPASLTELSQRIVAANTTTRLHDLRAYLRGTSSQSA